MGNCSAYMEPQNASGDIVGYGMLAAFLSSAVMTITAVLLAYYCDAMDDDLMTDRDHQLKCRIRRITDSIKHLFQDGIRKFRGKTIQHGDDLLLHNEVETQTNLREHRKACFTRFILALSDQQLVTGLAILITTLSSRKRLSNFEFSVAHSLAWFSSTTHLVTMDVILPTLKSQNRWVLNGRIAGMYLVLFLLYNTSIETWGTERVRIRPQGCQFIPASIPNKIQNYFAFIIIIHGHTKILAGFYTGYCFTRAARFLGFGESKRVSSSQFRAKRLADYQYDKLWAMEKWPRQRHLSQAIWEILEYSQAFFSTMPVIFFSLSYGICQVVEFAFLTAPNVTEESREMGFGQLMALFLLILPCLAAGESYSDYQKARLSASANNATDANAAENKNAEPDQARHPYDAEFENIKKYLYTAVEDPKEIPEDRRTFLYQEYQKVPEIERTQPARKDMGSGAFCLLCLYILLCTTLGVVLVIRDRFGLHLTGIVLSCVWITLTVAYWGAVMIKECSATSRARRIYDETERLVLAGKQSCSISPGQLNVPDNMDDEARVGSSETIAAKSLKAAAAVATARACLHVS